MSKNKSTLIIGQKFGRLTIINEAGKQYGIRCWNVLCDCGNHKVVSGYSIRIGATKSCGCLRREVASASKTTHDRYNTREHNSWRGMIERCNNPKNNHFHVYGGRGITVCDRWMEFNNFLEDMGEKPSPNHQIDRIDNDGIYSPSNCKWSTRSENARNKQNSVKVNYLGREMSIHEASELSGIHFATLKSRLKMGQDLFGPSRYKKGRRYRLTESIVSISD
jgi:hypothetical protein